MQSDLLQDFAARVQKVTDAFKLPRHEVAFADNGVYKEQMGKSVLSGKVNDVIKMHNDIHRITQSMSEACKAMDVDPPAQEHPSTCQVVAEATSMMSKAKFTSVLCRGVDLLCTHRDTVGGPALAQEFLDNYKAEGEKQSTKSLWTAIEAVAGSSASGTKASTPPHIQDNIPCKLEQGQATIAQASTAAQEGAKAVKAEPEGAKTEDPKQQSVPKRRGLKRPRG